MCVFVSRLCFSTNQFDYTKYFLLFLNYFDLLKVKAATDGNDDRKQIKRLNLLQSISQKI